MSASHSSAYLPKRTCNTVTPNLLRFSPRILCWDFRGFLLPGQKSLQNVTRLLAATFFER